MAEELGWHYWAVFVFRFASRAAAALRARRLRSWGVIEAAALRARSVRSAGVIEAAAFFPPLLPCLRKNLGLAKYSFRSL